MWEFRDTNSRLKLRLKLSRRKVQFDFIIRFNHDLYKLMFQANKTQLVLMILLFAHMFVSCCTQRTFTYQSHVGKQCLPITIMQPAFAPRLRTVAVWEFLATGSTPRSSWGTWHGTYILVSSRREPCSHEAVRASVLYSCKPACSSLQGRVQ